MRPLGLGISWRPELALSIERFPRLGFVELMVEHFPSHQPLPQAVLNLLQRGTIAIPHGLSLSLGGAEPPSPSRLREMASLAQRVAAPLVSEHLAFVRSPNWDSGHLMPLERSPAGLQVVLENLQRAQEALPVPLYLENISTLLEWPDPTWDEPEFLSRVVQASGCGILLDLSNLWANCLNHGGDPDRFLSRIPLERIGYVHVGGGLEHDGVYHDTHDAPIPDEVLQLLEELASRVDLPGVLLERDGNYPCEDEFLEEMNRIESALRHGQQRRSS